MVMGLAPAEEAHEQRQRRRPGHGTSPGPHLNSPTGTRGGTGEPHGLYIAEIAQFFGQNLRSGDPFSCETTLARRGLDICAPRRFAGGFPRVLARMAACLTRGRVARVDRRENGARSARDRRGFPGFARSNFPSGPAEAFEIEVAAELFDPIPLPGSRIDIRRRFVRLQIHNGWGFRPAISGRRRPVSSGSAQNSDP